jgi:hypothetical protein
MRIRELLRKLLDTFNCTAPGETKNIKHNKY